MTDSRPASAALLTVLAKVFHPGREYGNRFDYRSIASEVRNHPELLAALEFLEPQILTTGWRAGTLSDESKDRIKQWLISVEGQNLDGRQLQGDQFGRYRIVVRRDRVPSTGDTPGIADQAASATLLAVLSKIFWPGCPGGDQFDHRRIASEARNHPEMLTALGFLDVHKSTTGWRAGLLSDESMSRIKRWLDAIEGQELDGRQLRRDQFGRYRIVGRRDLIPPAGDTPRIVDPAASATLLTVLSETFWPGCKGGEQFDQRRIASEAHNHPKMLAALEFLDVHKSTTGWRAGLLSSESMSRIKQWLDSVEGQELDGRRLEREPFGRFRVKLLRHDEPPPFC